MRRFAHNLRQSGNERGAAAVEFAIVLPIFLMLLFGIIEYGLAFKDKLAVDNAVQTGGRVGAALGNNVDTDLHVLNAVNQGVATLPNRGTGVVERVEIFRADANGNPIAGDVNVYFLFQNDGPGGSNCDWDPCPDGDSPDDDDDPFGGTYGGGNWPPADRNVQVGSLDVIGVRVFYAHNWITGGLIPLPDSACDTGTDPTSGGDGTASNNCWVEETIMRLEPLQFSAEG